MVVKEHLREEEQGQIGQRNNNNDFVALGRAAFRLSIQKP